MKKSWEIKRLPEVAEYFIGLTYLPKDVSNKGTIVLRSSNIQNDELDLSDLVRVARPVKEGLIVRKGDILMCSRNGSKRLVGKTALIGNLPEEMTFGTFMTVIRSTANAYLAWFFKSDAFREQIGGGENTMINQITKYMLDAIRVPFAPPAEQQRIVGILNEAFDGVAIAKANAQKNLQNARALLESHLQAVFAHRGEGWMEKMVGEIAKHSLGKMLDRAKNKGVPQPYLRNVNVRWFTFDLSDLLEMRFLPDEAAKYTAIKGDVLICEGGYPGRAAIWNEDHPIYFQKALHRVRFDVPEHNKWFVYFLYVQDMTGKLREHFTGTGIQHFTGEALNRFQLPVAPLPELRRLVSEFDRLSTEIERLEAIYQQKLTALEALKKSLLHKAFSGELEKPNHE